MAGRLPMIKVKLDAFKASVGGGDQKTRISVNKVQEFNKILADIRTSFPDHQADLPADLSTKSIFDRTGQTDVFLPDLDYAIRLTLGVVALIESEQK